MSTAVKKQEVSVVSPGDIATWTPEQFDLLKRQFCKDLTDDEFQIFRYAVQRTGLDPFMKQIYAVKRKGKMCLQVGIDGYRLVADRTGVYAGCDDAVFDSEKEPNKATVTVYKMVQGQRCAYTASARWSEYYPGEREGFMWDKMPCVMLGKVAEALALRKAFPADLSGIYTEDEMAQADAKADQARPVQAEVAPVPFTMAQDQRETLKAAMKVNGYLNADLRAFTSKFSGGVPNSEQEYRETLLAMSQSKPKKALEAAVRSVEDFMAENRYTAKEEADLEFSANEMAYESRRIYDGESRKGCVVR